MGRIARVVNSDEKTIVRLTEMANSRTLPAHQAKRAGIIIDCINGLSIREIAKRFLISYSNVMRWKNRFLKQGISGLNDNIRSGRPITYDADFGKMLLGKIEEPPPLGYGQWTGSLLAEELNVSKDAIWRFLREQRINLARRRAWCVSTDPEFAAKAADIVGLYLDPPENAIVLCVDEKPNIQALERLTGYTVSSDQKLVHGLESTYKRNGTLNLFAALDVATGVINGDVTKCEGKTKKGFLKFMDNVLSELPSDMEYHVIMDNHSIHKRHEAWLKGHPNVFFHYTPTSASWLNMVEIWFGILKLKSLQGKNFTSTDELSSHIKNFIEAYNKTAHPFIWKKREVHGSQLKNNTRNFCN
jgi:transposase